MCLFLFYLFSLRIFVSAFGFKMPQVRALVAHGHDLPLTSLRAARKPVGPGERGLKGYYRRPSKAIEQGGGFFVPGLEDERIRLVTAAALIVAFVWNGYGAPVLYVNQIVTQMIGVFMIMLLIAQGIPKEVVQYSAGDYGAQALSPQSLACLQAPSFTTPRENKCMEAIANTIVQSVEGLHYVLVVYANDENMQSRLEVAPVSHSSCTTAPGLKVFSVDTTTGYHFFKGADQEACPVPVPVGSAATAIFSGTNDTLWVLSSVDASALEREKPFLAELMKAPV